MRAAVAGLFANLVAGARLAIFLPVTRQAFRIDAAQLVLAFIVSALIDNAADWVRLGPDATLDWSALGAELAALALLVTVAALLAWLFREAPLLLALPIVALVSLPLVQIVNVAPTLMAGVKDLPGTAATGVWYLVVAWFCAVLWRSAYVMLQPHARRLARSIASGLALALPLFLPVGVLPEGSWWTRSTTPPAVDATNPAAEPVLALQRELQEEALGAITDHVQGVTELYFVAFAPDGDGATWRPRIERAKRVMDERWATDGRSLAYVNDTSLLTQAPMATVTHLRQALEEIGGAIDPEEDVAMIYLAGRTNPDGSMLVSLPPLGLVQLSGAGLAHLLTQAGIRWRVIVVAACVPQTFHDALADENTLVFAAVGRGERAAGCADTGEPAAFADALFGESLMHASSLPAAFEGAQRKVASRGPAPVLHVGSAIAEQLKRLRGAGGGPRALSPGLSPTHAGEGRRIGALWRGSTAMRSGRAG